MDPSFVVDRCVNAFTPPYAQVSDARFKKHFVFASIIYDMQIPPIQAALFIMAETIAGAYV